MNSPTFILASHLGAYEKDENGVRYAITISDNNSIVTNIKKYLKGTKSFLFVANEPSMVEEHEEKARCIFQSFHMSDINFDSYAILNNNTKHMSEELVDNADLILLSGGKLICQMNFFEEVGLKSLLERSHALIIGTSAGAMNLCEKAFNFPERIIDIPEPRIVDGLGFYDKYIIPHLDGRNLKYECYADGVEPVTDYILPFSKKETLIGLNNNSYIILHDGIEEFVGEYYIIQDGQVSICN